MRRDIMGMSNEDVLRRYPDLVSKAHGRTCGSWTGYTNARRPCEAVATLRVGSKDLCASHAKSMLNYKVRS